MFSEYKLGGSLYLCILKGKKQSTDLKKMAEQTFCFCKWNRVFLFNCLCSMHLYYANHSRPNSLYYDNNCSLLQQHLKIPNRVQDPIILGTTHVHNKNSSSVKSLWSWHMTRHNRKREQTIAGEEWRGSYQESQCTGCAK